MDNYDDEHEHDELNVQAALGFLAGILIGGLAGAGTMLLLAPQSGKRTRAQIRHKGLELRDQATDTIQEAMTEARDDRRAPHGPGPEAGGQNPKAGRQAPAARPGSHRRAKRALVARGRSRAKGGQW